MSKRDDKSRLGRAFAVLRKHGYFAHGDVDGTRTDGWTEIGDDETPAVFWTTENARRRFKGGTSTGRYRCSGAAMPG